MKKQNKKIEYDIETVTLNLQNFISKKNNLEEYKYFIRLFDMDILENEELDFMDLFQIFAAIILSIFDVCLQDEEYEVCGLTKKCLEKECKNLNKLIRGIDDEERKELLLDELFFTEEYIQNSIINITNNKK